MADYINKDNKHSDISIIVPVYKGRQYIPEIIENIQKNAQYIKNKKIEIIFVNDFPEDKITIDNNPSEISIHLIENKKNMGIHASRQIGLDNSTGEFILFLDQDDRINEKFLLICYKTLKNNPYIPFVVCNGILENKDFIRVIYKSKFRQLLVKYKIFYALFNNRIVSPGQCLIRKRAIPQIWKHLTINHNGADDYLLWLLMLDNNMSPALVYKKLYRHRYTDRNASLDLSEMYHSVEEVAMVLEQNSGCSYLGKIISYRNQLEQGVKKKTEINYIIKIIIKLINWIKE